MEQQGGGDLKKDLGKTHFWKLILAVLFLAAGIRGLMLGSLFPALIALGLSAFLAVEWWKHRAVDRVILSRSAKRRSAMLDRMDDPEQILEIAEAGDGALREEALSRITDQNVFLERVKRFDAFALDQITDPQLLSRVASDIFDFQRWDERRETKEQYEARCLKLQKRAVDRLDDEETLLGLAEGMGSAFYGSANQYAAEKLLREHPDRAEELYRCDGIPWKVRSLAADGMVARVKEQIRDDPAAAVSLCRDRDLPITARLAAVRAISDQEQLFSCYYPEDSDSMRRQIAEQLTSQPLLIAFAEKEPQKEIREIAECKVSDPEQRRRYCEKNEAHDDELIDSRWEENGDVRDEIETYRCRFCGRTRVEIGDRMRM